MKERDEDEVVAPVKERDEVAAPVERRMKLLMVVRMNS